MSKNLFKKSLLLILFSLILSGCIIVVETPVYNPYKTINTLKFGVVNGYYETIKSCFTSTVDVWSIDDYGQIQNTTWMDKNAADFFFFTANQYNSPVFYLNNVNTSIYYYNDTAKITGNLFIKGTRDNLNIEIKGPITFMLRRFRGDNWYIYYLDLSNVNFDKLGETHSI